MITVTYRCGHIHTLTGDETVPYCHCGERAIAVVKAPAPRFRGHVSGPHAETLDLPAVPVSLEKKA